MREKAPYFMNQCDQQVHIYHAFCRKIKIKLHENSSPMLYQDTEDQCRQLVVADVTW